MGVSHLSLYQLTIEDGTAFGDRFRAGKLTGLPEEDSSARMYEVTQDICDAAGLPAYEISNHAANGEESRHNIIYWKSGDYAGIGPGAHGRLTLDGIRHATEQTRNPKAWLSGKRTVDFSALSKTDHAREMLLMGLRIAEGFDLRNFESATGQSLSQTTLNELSEEGWIDVKDDILHVSQNGRLLLNALLLRLLP